MFIAVNVEIYTRINIKVVLKNFNTICNYIKTKQHNIIL